MPVPLTYMKYQKSVNEFRYVRDWCMGGSDEYYGANTGTWREIQVLDKTGTNIALGKPSSFSVPIEHVVSPEELNDGIINENEFNGTDFYSISDKYAQIDLGDLYEIMEVKVWHGWTPQHLDTFKGTKTEVSADGINWTTIFDSAISGEYLETLEGKTHLVPSGVLNVPIYHIPFFPNSPLRIMTNKGLGTFNLITPTSQTPVRVMTTNGVRGIDLEVVFNSNLIDGNVTPGILNGATIVRGLPSEYVEILANLLYSGVYYNLPIGSILSNSVYNISVKVEISVRQLSSGTIAVRIYNATKSLATGTGWSINTLGETTLNVAFQTGAILNTDQYRLEFYHLDELNPAGKLEFRIHKSSLTFTLS